MEKKALKSVDIFLMNDWQASLASTFARTKFKYNPTIGQIKKFVLFIHNLGEGYQGRFSERFFPWLGLDYADLHGFTASGVNDQGLQGNNRELNLMSASAFHSDGASVPSVAYRAMGLIDYFGNQLTPFLRRLGDHFVGVANGLIYDKWASPLKDAKDIREFLKSKEKAKIALLTESGLMNQIIKRVDQEVTRDGKTEAQYKKARKDWLQNELNRPIEGAVVRLDVRQKGLSFYRETLEDWLSSPNGGRFILQGPVTAGDQASEDFARFMEHLVRKYPDRVAFIPKFNHPLPSEGLHREFDLGWPIEKMSDLIHAGSDFCSAPAAYEPFGFNITEMLRYGTPVVASTRGGPLEQLVHVDEDPKRATGILFGENPIQDKRPGVPNGPYSAQAYNAARWRMADIYRNHRPDFKRMQINAANTRITAGDSAANHLRFWASLLVRQDVVDDVRKPIDRVNGVHHGFIYVPLMFSIVALGGLIIPDTRLPTIFVIAATSLVRVLLRKPPSGSGPSQAISAAA